MSYTPLTTNFKDDILPDGVTRRKYRQISNDDGTVSFEDVTEYSQEGSIYGAKEANEVRAAINRMHSDKLISLDDIELIKEDGHFVDAMVVLELINHISKLEKAGWHRLKREGFPGSSGSVTWNMNWDENEPRMFMLVLGSCPSPASSATEKDYNRRLCTTIIPRDNAIETIGVDKSNGAHQAYYNGTISGGISFLSKSQVKAYYSGEVLIELMAWY